MRTQACTVATRRNHPLQRGATTNPLQRLAQLFQRECDPCKTARSHAAHPGATRIVAAEAEAMASGLIRCHVLNGCATMCSARYSRGTYGESWGGSRRVRDGDERVHVAADPARDGVGHERLRHDRVHLAPARAYVFTNPCTVSLRPCAITRGRLRAHLDRLELQPCERTEQRRDELADRVPGGHTPHSSGNEPRNVYESPYGPCAESLRTERGRAAATKERMGSTSGPGLAENKTARTTEAEQRGSCQECNT
jgi:hypothetical protein